MNTAEMIACKQAGKTHTPDEIKSFIHGFAMGTVPDSVVAAWLMAVYFNGMDDVETIACLDAMITSGDQMDFSHLNRFTADKHSTGGVGDKVSLILGPLLASAGLSIPMISGRSLGHTGGTLDKLESIPGYQTDLSLEIFREIVERTGISMIGQTDNICPADKKIYALRDATSTVRSIPLIVSSIMSKKIAEGIRGLVLDIKVGNGAFMKTKKKARLLAEKLIYAGTHFGVTTEAVFTNMDQPLGIYAGLWCEVNESIKALNGEGPEDLLEVTYELGNRLLCQSGITKNNDDARNLQNSLITNGKAFEKFIEMTEAHGGDTSYLENPDNYHQPRYVSNLLAYRDGFISQMDTYHLGLSVNYLTIMNHNGNRVKDNSAGIRFYHKVGVQVKAGEVIASCFGNDENKVNKTVTNLRNYIRIHEEQVTPIPVIIT